MEDTRFTIPLYTITEAAYHLRMSPSTLRYWEGKEGLITTVSPETSRGANLPFIALVEAQLYLKLRSEGLSLQAITSGMKKVREHLGSSMLKKETLAHDGKRILINLARTSNAPEWTRAPEMQIAIPQIIDDSLRLISWDDLQYPQSIRLTAYGDGSIIADHRFAYGRPIIQGTRIRVEDITQPFRAGETIMNICNELSVSIQIVESIIRAHLDRAA